MSALVEPQGLLTIPAEVRNLIYKELWTDSVIYVEISCSNYWEAIKEPEGINLLQSCRAMNREALPVFLRCCRSIVIKERTSSDPPWQRSNNPFSSNSFSRSEQSGRPKRLPTRILQGLPYVKQLYCLLDIPHWTSITQPKFPLPDQLDLLPQLEKLVLVDTKARAVDQFLLDHSGWFSSDGIQAFFEMVVEIEKERFMDRLRDVSYSKRLEDMDRARRLRQSQGNVQEMT